MKGSIAKEPVIASMIARLIVGWASAKGLELTIDQVLVIVTVLEAVLAWVVRKNVEPTVVAKARMSAPPAGQ